MKEKKDKNKKAEKVGEDECDASSPTPREFPTV